MDSQKFTLQSLKDTLNCHMVIGVRLKDIFGLMISKYYLTITHCLFKLSPTRKVSSSLFL